MNLKKTGCPGTQEPIPEGLKRCSKDGEIKPLDCFQNNKTTKDGKQSHCSECRSRALHDKNKEASEKRIENGIQICERCEEEKPLEMYSPAPRRLTGIDPICIECRDQIVVERKERGKIRAKERYQENENKTKEKAKARKKIYYYSNQEKVLEQAREYTAAHKEERREYRNSNREKLTALENKRRARKFGNGGEHTLEEWLDLLELYDYTCLYPGCTTRHMDDDKPLQRDHVESLHNGGSDDISNIQPLCGYHNGSKGRHSIDYRVT